MVRNKIIKLSTIIGTLFLIVICFNSPFFIDLSKEKNNMIIKDKLNTKRTVLSSLFNTKANSKLSVYIIWDSYDVKNLPKEIPHHKILYTKNNYLIKRLLQVSFLYTGGDMSTLNSRLIIIQDGYKLYESQIILSSHPLKTIFQHKACTDKLYADSFYKVQKNSHSSFEVICCRS